MALYVLTYDLRKARNYDKLYEELKRFNAQRVLESTWCFKRINTNSAGLRDHFKQFIDDDDGLFVVEVTGWATYRAQSSPSKLP
jgi:CRISPR/Cas system-associated endoribonuclease Cas2